MFLDEMTKTERVAAAVHGDEVDRIPVCFWHHFRPEGSGRLMAQATLDFFENTFDLDILKLMPDIPYPFPRYAISDPQDWRLIEHLSPRRSHYLNQRSTAVRVLREAVGYETPIIVTVYNPLSEAMHFTKDRQTFLEHAREHPSLVHGALATIAENLRLHMRECIEDGADGIFFALQGCTREVMSPEEYQEFGRPYDLIALQGAIDGWLNVLHVHGTKDLYFQQALDYPVQVLSWSDRLAGPSLREARTMTSKCLMGGWNEQGALAHGPVEQIREEAEDALKQTGGRKLILANGCSVPDDTEAEWLEAARALVDELEVP